MAGAQQWVTFTIRPENVILTVDETRMVIRDGRARVLLNPGPHRYTAESPYYEILADTFTLKDSLRCDLLLVLQSEYSYIDVETHYNNARIYVDQQVIGKGQTVSSRITSGDHRLTVISDTMCLFDGKVVMERAEKKMVDIATLNFTPFPWESARWLIPLSALGADGAIADSMLLEEAHTEMALGQCLANVTSNVSGAEIYIDGKYYGTTPLVIPGLVANRRYMVTLRKQGYDEVSTVFHAQTNIVGEVKMKMKKKI